MQVKSLVDLCKRDGELGTHNRVERLTRYAAMVGWDSFGSHYKESDPTDVPADVVRQILALDYAER